jgi:hypothetical protein
VKIKDFALRIAEDKDQRSHLDLRYGIGVVDRNIQNQPAMSIDEFIESLRGLPGNEVDRTHGDWLRGRAWKLDGLIFVRISHNHEIWVSLDGEPVQLAPQDYEGAICWIVATQRTAMSHVEQRKRYEAIEVMEWAKEVNRWMDEMDWVKQAQRKIWEKEISES